MVFKESDDAWDSVGNLIVGRGAKLREGRAGARETEGSGEGSASATEGLGGLHRRLVMSTLCIWWWRSYVYALRSLRPISRSSPASTLRRHALKRAQSRRRYSRRRYSRRPIRGTGARHWPVILCAAWPLPVRVPGLVSSRCGHFAAAQNITAGCPRIYLCACAYGYARVSACAHAGAGAHAHGSLARMWVADAHAHAHASECVRGFCVCVFTS